MVAQYMEDKVRPTFSGNVVIANLNASRRYALNIKGISYKTEWVEYPDIEAIAKKIGAPPTVMTDGTPGYAVPIISDPNTGKVISDSFLIAEYLDATYPNGKTLFPSGTKPLLAAFESGIINALSGVFLLLLIATYDILNPSSKVYFKRTREDRFGKKLEEFSPAGKRDADVAKGKVGLDTVDGWLAKSEGKFVLGDTISYADGILSGWLTWIKITDSEVWKDVATWHNGRWATYLENMEKAGYASVVV